jgi:hypothetical protein
MDDEFRFALSNGKVVRVTPRSVVAADGSQALEARDLREVATMMTGALNRLIDQAADQRALIRLMDKDEGGA